MKNTVYILLALVTLFLQRVSGEENSSYYFTHINGDNGLSSSNVKAIIQDSYGFMWFGTKNGLNRFDGTSILRMNCEDHQLKKAIITFPLYMKTPTVICGSVQIGVSICIIRLRTYLRISIKRVKKVKRWITGSRLL